MAKIPDHKTDYAQEFPRYTQPMDFGLAVLPSLIEGVCDVIQDQLEDPLALILSQNNVANATGVMLDYWGELVDEARRGRADVDYRIAIRAKIRRNKASGTWDELIDIARSIYGSETMPVIVTESYPAEGILEAQLDVTTVNVDPDLAFAILNRSRAAGVRLHYIAWESDADHVFSFSDLATLTTGDNDKGFADDAQTTGGLLATALADGE